MLNKGFWVGFKNGAFDYLKACMIVAGFVGLLIGVILGMSFIIQTCGPIPLIILVIIIFCTIGGIINGITIKRRVDECYNDIAIYKDAIASDERRIRELEMEDINKEEIQKQISYHKQSILDYEDCIKCEKERIDKIIKRGR